MGILTILTFFPLLGVLALLLLKPLTKKEPENTVKGIAIGTSLITFLLSVFLLVLFDLNEPGLQFVERFAWIPNWGIQYYMGVDGISILMVLLTTFITFLAIVSSWSAMRSR